MSSISHVQIFRINCLIPIESQRNVVIAGYSWFAMGKELKLSRSQGMYVIFAKDDQGFGLGQIMRWSVCLWKRYAGWFQKDVKNGSW